MFTSRIRPPKTFCRGSGRSNMVLSLYFKRSFEPSKGMSLADLMMLVAGTTGNEDSHQPRCEEHSFTLQNQFWQMKAKLAMWLGFNGLQSELSHRRHSHSGVGSFGERKHSIGAAVVTPAVVEVHWSALLHRSSSHNYTLMSKSPGPSEA